MQMFLLECPKCKQRMKYHTQERMLSKKRKRCVYCGRSFIAKEHIVQKIL